jgi:CubicO group peptidase (beta-lactamase class C family)
MLSAVLVLELSLVVAAQSQLASSVNQPSEKPLTEKADQLFAPWSKPDSPGCALGVIKDGKIIYKRGYGMANLDYSIPISATSVFYIGSTSKQLTAASVALLARQGKLSLDDDIRKYLPEMPQYESPVTIRHLIHHTSGIRDYLELMGLAGMPHENIYTDQELINLIARQKRLNFKPGDKHLYSNSGYFLLSQIVKRASGKSLRQFAEENIFKPLGMKNTHFHDDRTMIVKNRATGYAPSNGSFSIVLTNFDKVGDGGLLTTVEDLYLWDQNFYDNKLGGADFLNQLLTPGTLNSGEKLDYAFGLTVGQYKGLKMVSHGGAFIGFRAEMIRFPEQKFSVICLCNLGNINPSPLALQVADIYLADQLKPGEAAASKSPISEPASVKVSEQELTSKVGQYYNQDNKTVRSLSLKDGKLMYVRGPGNESELIPLDENRFLISGVPTKIEVIFKSPREGIPPEMHVRAEGQTPTIFRAFKIASPTDVELADYAGDYYSDELGAAFKVLAKDGGLFLTAKHISEVKLMPTIKDEFTVGNLIITFVRDTQNRVSGFNLDGGRVKNIEFGKKAAEQKASN